MLVFPKICFVFLKHPSWNSLFCLITEEINKKKSKNRHENNDFENWNGTENGFVPNEKNSAFAKKQLLEKYFNK